MILEINSICNKGKVRDRNEDMILCGMELIRNSGSQKHIELTDDTRFVIAVADGMGGHNGGDVASEIVCKRFSNFFNRLATGLSSGQLKEELNNWIQDVHLEIIRKGKQIPDLYGMGSTFVGLLFYEHQILWINCGDSRIYRLRNNILTQLSKDHSLAALTGNENIPANIITNSIGAGTAAYLDIHYMTDLVFNGDAFLLCSDGLTDTIDDDTIEQTLLQASLDELINNAVNAEAADNVSASYIKISTNK